ncbi:MAG: carboxylesterase/lipase family protein [Hyphomicrobium sp.]
MCRLLVVFCVFLALPLSPFAVAHAKEASAKATTAAATQCSTPTVHTTSGLVCGLEHEVAGNPVPTAKPISAFLGVPYAQSTAGNNRWAPPKPIVQWSAELRSDIFKATRFGPTCPQKLRPGIDLELSEDCLSLNIWTPVPLQQIGSSDPVPVMVFIYGGSFREGTTSNPLYDARHLAAKGGVVVVSVNYRVGALGFLSGIDGLKGNYGLMDQRLALEWVHDNIAEFGGDPDRITLFGESAGAMSVGLHLISPESQPLFNAAIIESNPYAIPYKSLGVSTRFATILKSSLGCEFEGLSCLRAKSFDEIVAQQQAGMLPIVSLLTGFAAELIWAPVVDGKQVPAQPSASAITKPAIIGTNLNEGIIFAVSQQTRLGGGKEKVLKLQYELMLDVMFSVETAGRIKAHPRYKPHGGDNTNVLSHLITDYLFTCANRHVMAQAKAPVWAYQFTHPPSYDIWPDIKQCAPAKDTVCHAAELPFVFANADTAQIQAKPQRHVLQPDEKRLSRLVMRYWMQFAKRENPNADGSPKWVQFKKESPSRLILNTKTASKTDLDANCAFWDEIGYNMPGFLERVRKF